MNIGVEVEFTGIRRLDAALTVCNALDISHDVIIKTKTKKNFTVFKIPSEYGEWAIWVDTSIRVSDWVDGQLGAEMYRCELITPVLDVMDLSVLYHVLEELRIVGAEVNETCGVHIHVDYVDNSSWVNRLLDKVYRYEKSNILDYFHVPAFRRSKYCKSIPDEAFDALQKSAENYSKDSFLNTLYEVLGNGKTSSCFKNPARYYWVNFDSVSKRNTVEFRLFNSTFDERQIRSYVAFVVDTVSL